MCGFVLADLKLKEHRRKEGVWALELLDIDNWKSNLKLWKTDWFSQTGRINVSALQEYTCKL